METNDSRRKFVATGAAMVAAAAAATSATAQAQTPRPDATIDIRIFRAGFIVGGSGGSGTLYFRDKGYNLGVGGVSLGATIGVARADFVGEVYNLREARDIEGTYAAVGASAAAAGGVGITELQNQRGVRLRLQGTQIGLMVSIDLSGMIISIRN
ncbi:MAG: DUF1134 domain-containing protein [Burkholderiales bacterium]|nr:DUF1134 domain-containing protein [Burkholderiales bacterium]